jgi:hypothetical protein
MIKRTVFGMCLVAMMAMGGSAMAGEPEGNKFRLGAGLDVGVPSGGSLGIVMSPWIPQLKLGVYGSYNGLAPGMKGSATIDPFNFPVSLTLTGEVGGFWAGQVPGVNGSPSVSYTYENLLLGLEFGKRTGFRFYFRGGLTHLDANVSNFQNTFTPPANVSVGNPHLSATAAPAVAIGLQWLF